MLDVLSYNFVHKSKVLMGSDDSFIGLPTETSKFKCKCTTMESKKSKGTYKCYRVQISFSIIL